MIRACKDAGLAVPVFDMGLRTCMVFLMRPGGVQRDETREKTREKIIEALIRNPQITQQQLAESIGISCKGVEWNLRKLREAGRIRRVGPDKGGHWEVIP